MKHQGQPHDTLRTLRMRAEQTLQDLLPAPTHEQGDRMLRELRLHELELRMQNDELQHLCEEVHGLNERYVDLFMSAPIAYLVLDSQSRIVSANLAASQLLGIEHALLHGLKISSFVEAELTESFVRHMRAVLRSEGTHKAELNLRLSNDTFREVRFESVRDMRRPDEWRAAVIDLTDVRRLERELERARSLEAIGTFAAGLAHDFGNLLNLVAMGVDLAIEVSTQAEAKAPLVRIQRVVREGRRMVRQLLRYSSAREREDSQTFAIDGAVSDVEPELRRLCAGETVALEIRLGAPDTHIQLDMGAPEEILLNLAVNAIHAMPKGGVLSVETAISAEPSELGGRRPGQRYAVLRVADTGRGMEAETRRRAFEPFFTTRRGTGTGLGLPMVQKIVTRAGGHVQLESEPGKGTIITIYLPVCDRPSFEH